MNYRRAFFNPPPPRPVPSEDALEPHGPTNGREYVYTESIVLAVNVALATGRPLLVSGPPGSGKSTLARAIATALEREYLDEIITARTQARDLLWRFDALRRLQEANIGRSRDELKAEHFVRPGVLWRAFTLGAAGKPAVVLLDEMDKADPDVPNSLLEVLELRRFTVEETEAEIAATPESAPLVVITTNDERDLSRPFVRRCVVATLPGPDTERLIQIAAAHGLCEDGHHALATALAEIVAGFASDAVRLGERVPSAAEYLDALRACRLLDISPGSEEWDVLARAALLKPLAPENASPGPS